MVVFILQMRMCLLVIALILNRLSVSAQKSEARDTSVEKSAVQVDRFEMTPSIANENGEPLLVQVEISEEVFRTVPDTLQKLAKSRYTSYRPFFSRSISCDFEGGNSKEHVNFPKRLTFRFMVFEDSYSLKPWSTKEIVVIRSKTGELSTE